MLHNLPLKSTIFFFGLLTCELVTGQNLVDFESHKKINCIDISEADRAFRKGRDEFYYKFLTSDLEEFRLLKLVCPNDKPDLSSINDTNNRNAEQQIDAEEAEVKGKVFAAIKNVAYKYLVISWWNEYLTCCKINHYRFRPSNAALHLAQRVKRNGDTKLALALFHISHCGFNNDNDAIYLYMAETLVSFFNKYVEGKRPALPTSELFSALLEAIKYNSCDRGDGDPGVLGEERNKVLIRYRDKMVRFPLAPKAIFEDQFYPPSQLAKLVYAPKFVENLLKDVSDFRDLWSFKTFDDTKNNDNIFSMLKERRFYSIEGKYKGDTQYILINDKGYIVRIKRARDGFEMTLGLTLINPLVWKDGMPQAILKQDPELTTPSPFRMSMNKYGRLYELQCNEVFKICIDNDLIMIIPAFKRSVFKTQNFWALEKRHGDFLMDSAHRKLKRVGTKTKRRRNSKAINNQCLSVSKSAQTQEKTSCL